VCINIVLMNFDVYNETLILNGTLLTNLTIYIHQKFHFLYDLDYLLGLSDLEMFKGCLCWKLS